MIEHPGLEKKLSMSDQIQLGLHIQDICSEIVRCPTATMSPVHVSNTENIDSNVRPKMRAGCSYMYKLRGSIVDLSVTPVTAIPVTIDWEIFVI